MPPPIPGQWSSQATDEVSHNHFDQDWFASRSSTRINLINLTEKIFSFLILCQKIHMDHNQQTGFKQQLTTGAFREPLKSNQPLSLSVKGQRNPPKRRGVEQLSLFSPCASSSHRSSHSSHRRCRRWESAVLLWKKGEISSVCSWRHFSVGA